MLKRISPPELLVVAAGFVALTMVMTYPQGFVLQSAFDGQSDSLFSTWRIAWIAHQLRVDPRHLFDANIFYPQRFTLAYSDAALLIGVLAAPLVWAGVHPIVVYNLAVLGSFAACGVTMYLLVRALTGS